MQRKLFRLLFGLFLGLAGSIIILFFIRNRSGEKFSFKKLFTMHTLQQLSLIYDLIIEGVPDEEQNIVTNVLRALRSANHLYEQMFSVHRFDKFAKFVQDENFVMSDNEFIIPLIKNTKLLQKAIINNSAYDLGDGLFVSSITFPDGDKIYVANIQPSEEEASNRYAKDGDGAIALSPGFNLQTKLDMFWEYYQKGIFIRSANEYTDANFSNNSDNLVIEDLDSLVCKFYGNSGAHLDKFENKLKKFREDKLQRSYLLLGLAGTGKSSFAVEISRRISNRLVKISSSLFRTFDREDINFIFKCLRPDSVIIDDFDRVFQDMSDADMLYFFEQLKTSDLNVTVFCTINEIKRLGKAIIRPGRFDDIVVFNLPNEAERHEMIKSFVSDLNLNVSPTVKQIKKLVDITEGFSPAYLKEYCLQLKYEPSFGALIRRIEMTKQFVLEEDFASGDPDNTDLDNDYY